MHNTNLKKETIRNWLSEYVKEIVAEKKDTKLEENLEEESKFD